jgi:hypothetical protein
MTRAVMFSSDRGDLPFNMPLTNNYAATTNPGVNDDRAHGYEVGSQWINTATGTAYQCLDSTTGAAVWAVDTNGSGLIAQGAPATQDTAATLTAAQLLTGIIQSTPAGAINLTLPTQAAMDTALPKSVAGQAFDFSIINTSAGANTITVLANSWTTVGLLTMAQNVSGRFRARKTGTGAWTLYRIS